MIERTDDTHDNQVARLQSIVRQRRIRWEITRVVESLHTARLLAIGSPRASARRAAVEIGG
jgi:hypothetical protein